MVAAAEALYGPYRWGRYDVLVLPPSFPFGGMENPRLTFATPTILAGDRSLVVADRARARALVVGQPRHQRDVERLLAERRASRSTSSRGSWRRSTAPSARRCSKCSAGASCTDEIAQARHRRRRDTRAAPRSRRPQPRRRRDARSPTTRARRSCRLIEQAVGRERVRRAGCAPGSIATPSRSVTTDEFVADLRANLLADDAALEARCSSTTWLDSPGLPANATRRRRRRFDAVDAAGRRSSPAGTPAAALDTEAGCTQQWQHFLGALPDDAHARRSSPISIGPSASRSRATARSCSPGCGSPSGTATSRRCRRSSGS